MIDSTINYLLSERVEPLFIGVFLALGIYKLLVWFRVRERSNYLYFMMFALALTMEAVGGQLSLYYNSHFMHNTLISLVPATFMILLGESYRFRIYTALAKVLGISLIIVNTIFSLLAFTLDNEQFQHFGYLLILAHVTFFFFYTLLKVVRSPDKKYDILISIVVSGTLCGSGALHYALGLNPPVIIFYISYLVTFIAFANNLSEEYHQNYRELLELKESLEEQVEEKTAELNRSNIKLKNLIDIIGHDFKDNLSGILNCFNRYTKEFSPDYETLIRKELTRLTHDMNVISSSKKDGAEIINYDHSTVLDFGAALKSKVKFYRVELEEKGYNIKLTVDITHQVLVKSDSTAMDSIISNLLSNAVKYTLLKEGEEPGYVNITLAATRDSCQLTIKDNGLGIKAENHNHIFDLFFRESDRLKGSSGSGLGLSIVKGAVDSLGGSITVDSEEGAGTIFKVTLPRYRGKIESPPGTGQNEEIIEVEPTTIDKFRQEFDEEHYNILYVENELKHIRLFCDEYGDSFNIYLASNGKEAIELLETIARPHLIISDINMPLMDGFSFRKAVSESYGDIPFIFLTALNDDNLPSHSYQTGALAILQKTDLDYSLLKLQITAFCTLSDIKREQIEAVAEIYSREKVEQIARKFAFNEVRTHILSYMLEGHSIINSKHLLLENNSISITAGTTKRNRSDVLRIIRKGGYEYVTDIGTLRVFFNSFNPDKH